LQPLAGEVLGGGHERREILPPFIGPKALLEPLLPLGTQEPYRVPANSLSVVKKPQKVVTDMFVWHSWFGGPSPVPLVS
jgi:hypothetical protein